MEQWNCGTLELCSEKKPGIFIPGLGSIENDFGNFLFCSHFSDFSVLNRDNRHKGTVIPAFPELNSAVDKGEKCMIFAHSNIQAWIVAGSPLPDNNIACLGELSSVNLNTQPFAV
jgi:hypothetical protein